VSLLGAGGGRFRGGGFLLHGIEQALLDFITNTYDTIGWPGVIVMMAIESAAIPLPSEFIMPVAGWKLIEAKDRGWEFILLAGVFGAIGNVIGSWIAYAVGAWGGRPFAEKYGKYVLVSKHDLDLADRFFARWGNWAVFFSRMLPVVRTFISVPAGIVRMPIWQFTIYTFLGALPWCIGLTYGGYKLGENYEDLRAWMRPVDYPIAAILAALLVWYVYRHVKRAWGEGGTEAVDAEGTS
jgi:membrane protein DedA with SNARE-associated domain